MIKLQPQWYALVRHTLLITSGLELYLFYLAMQYWSGFCTASRANFFPRMTLTLFGPIFESESARLDPIFCVLLSHSKAKLYFRMLHVLLVSLV